MDESSTQRWCLGMPQIAERVLTEPELLALRQENQGLAPRAALWLVLPGLIPTGLALLCFALHWTVLGVVFAVVQMPGWFVGPLQAWRRGRRTWILRQEIADPRVATFGAVLEAEHAAWVARTLRLLAPGAGPFQFDVNLGSGRLLEAGGWAPQRSVVLNVESVAPKRSSDLADPERPERALSADECAELRRHARRAWSPLLLPGAIILVAGLLELLRRPALPASGWGVLGNAIWAATLVVFGAALLRTAWRSRRLQADANSGRVLRAELGVGAERVACEVLASSRAFWNVAGKPAGWRTGARPRR